MKRILRPLKGRTPAELRLRGIQALRARLERMGLSPHIGEPTDERFLRWLDVRARPRGPSLADELLRRFRARRHPHFFAGFNDRAATIEALRRGSPEAERAVVEKADEIVRGRFPLFGWHGVECGADAPDWHWDPQSGKRAPLCHWSTVRYLDPQSVGDSKVIWELNRHQYFTILGRAYWYTGDERYARAFVRHLTSWIDANPPKLGINWASSLEIAFRAISWLWSLHFFRDASALTPGVFLRALKLLYLHGRHLEKYLSTYFSPNTHLTGEAVGLFYLGVLLPEFTRADAWRETGFRILRDQLAAQVRADGVYFEQATQYHRYTTDFYAHALILGEANGLPVRGIIEPTLTALLEHLMHMTRPDGGTPLVGDDDGGQLVMLEERPANDFRDTLATGAALLGRPDLAFVAGEASPQTIWLLGPAGRRRFQALDKAVPLESSRAFHDGGYFVMRDGWHAQANFALIDCGPHGALSSGHAHADALAVEIVARGHPFIIDAGTFTYTGSSELRNYFRSTAAHNTVTVDGQSSSVPASTFRWSRTARARLIRWISDSRFDYFEGAHDGYARLAKPAIHRRSVLFLKGEYWLIRDQVDSDGRHRISAHFHCAPGVSASVEDDRDVVLTGTAASDGATLRIAAFAPGLVITRADQCVSPSYGVCEPATDCVLTTEGEGHQELVTFLLTGSSPGSAGQVTEIEAVRGRVFNVVREDATDTLLIGGVDGAEGAGVSTDGRWAFVRRSHDGVALEFLVLDGRTLRVDGSVVFRSDGLAGHVAGRLVDGMWCLQSDNYSHMRPRVNSELSAPCVASAE